MKKEKNLFYQEFLLRNQAEKIEEIPLLSIVKEIRMSKEKMASMSFLEIYDYKQMLNSLEEYLEKKIEADPILQAIVEFVYVQYGDNFYNSKYDLEQLSEAVKSVLMQGLIYSSQIIKKYFSKILIYYKFSLEK